MTNELLHEVDGRAQELEVSRSEFFSRAARTYLDDQAKESLTIRIDAALAVAGADDSSAAAVEAGRSRLLNSAKP